MLRLIVKLLIFGFLAAKISNVYSQNKATQKRYIKSMQTYVSFIGFGALELGRDWGVGSAQERRHVAKAQADEVLQTVLRSGITVIDTAASYGLSESYLGQCQACKQQPVIISTKAGESSLLATDPECQQPAHDGVYCNRPAARYDFSRQAIIQDVENSLKNLNLSKLDMVFIHFDADPKKVLDQGEAVATLKELKRAGKIRFIGASLDDPEQLKRCILSGDFDAVQFEYNLLNQRNRANIDLAHSKGLGVFVRGGLGTGLLTSRVAPYLDDPQLPYHSQIKALLKLTHGNYETLTALALAFLYQNKSISSVIIGSKNLSHVQTNLNLLNKFNDPALLHQAQALMAEFKSEAFTNSVDGYFAKQANALEDRHRQPIPYVKTDHQPNTTYH